ncbi:MAG: tRNA (adenosine(37)-N6)-dimethylallyltransferase MiaA [Gammaproteobacteria bacterium WSBS_2016_MAG_OTU1]
MKPPLLALAGPTAVGKTRLSLSLAEYLNGEIISVDSGAVYRDLNIGVAKPPPAALARVPHHLINICTPDNIFSAGDFCRLATAAAQEISARGKTPIFVGGAMMYFRSLTEGMHDFPTIAPDIQQKVRQDMQQHGAIHMHKFLATVDSTSAQKLNNTDSQRIGRALEIYHATGCPMSEILAKPKTTAPMPLAAILLVPHDREQLRAAIMVRLQQMLADGLADETKEAIKQYNLSPEALCLRMAGYKQAAEFLRGECDEEQFLSRAYIATCQLAKRQLTWLRKWANPTAIINPFAAEAESQIIEAVNRAGFEPT